MIPENEARISIYSSPTEMLHSPENFHEVVIRNQFEILKNTVNKDTGLWPAVEPGVGEKEAREKDDMENAWIRDTAMNLIGLIETTAILKKMKSNSSLVNEMSEFISEDIHRLIKFLSEEKDNQTDCGVGVPMLRWSDRFRQEVITNENYSKLADPKIGAPEIHLKTNGNPHEWLRQNQPDSWGELLIAIGRAHQTRIVDKYSSNGPDNPIDNEMLFIKRVTGYLCRIQPWHFECSGMWEDPEVHTPTPRSTALIIIKGLKAIRDVVDGDKIQKDIHVALRRTMDFIKEDPNIDGTSPDDHGDGADLAMLIAEAMPCTERTWMPADEYIKANGDRLSINNLPAAKRHLYDRYKQNLNVPIGEARWFISNPTLVINYSQAARVAIEKKRECGGYELAAQDFRISNARFNQTLAVLDYYGYAPELFTPTDPNCVMSEDKPWIETDPSENVLLVPLKRGLLWNRAFIAWAAAENLYTKHEIQNLVNRIEFAPGFFDLD